MIKTKKWWKNINKDLKVINFDNLILEPVNLFIILTARGQGKTMNMLIFIREQYLKFQKKSVWCFNSRVQLDISLARFLSNPKIHYPKLFKDVKIDSKGVFDEKTKEYFILFVALSSAGAHKTGRDESIFYLILDEFNESIQHIRKKQVALFESIFYTFSNPQKPQNLKVFIFGNQKSLTSSLILPSLGIEKIDKELTYFDKPKTLFWVPQKSNSYTKINNNWINEFSYKVGLGLQSVENINIEDNYDNVVEKDEKKLMIENWKIDDSLKLDQFWFKIFINNNKMLFVRNIEKPKNKIYCANIKDVESGIIFNPQLRILLINAFMNKQLFFDSFFTKALIFGLF